MLLILLLLLLLQCYSSSCYCYYNATHPPPATVITMLLILLLLLLLQCYSSSSCYCYYYSKQQQQQQKVNPPGMISTKRFFSTLFGSRAAHFTFLASDFNALRRCERTYNLYYNLNTIQLHNSWDPMCGSRGCPSARAPPVFPPDLFFSQN